MARKSRSPQTIHSQLAVVPCILDWTASWMYTRTFHPRQIRRLQSRSSSMEFGLLGFQVHDHVTHQIPCYDRKSIQHDHLRSTRQWRLLLSRTSSHYISQQSQCPAVDTELHLKSDDKSNCSLYGRGPGNVQPDQHFC